MNIDLLALPGHKGLFGPTGTGALYAGPRTTVRVWREGGTGGDSASETQLTEFPYWLEGGTPNVLGVAGLAAGIRHVREQGMRGDSRPRIGSGGMTVATVGNAGRPSRSSATSRTTPSASAHSVSAAKCFRAAEARRASSITPSTWPSVPVCTSRPVHPHRSLGTFPDGRHGPRSVPARSTPKRKSPNSADALGQIVAL